MNVIENKKISGLYYIKNIIKNHEEIIQKLDKKEWKPLTKSDNSRMVQHYGFSYDYKKLNIKEKIKDIPDFLIKLKDNLYHICKHLNIIDKDYIFNQCIVNNYYKKQSISKHIDILDFGKVICCYTLNDKAVMRFCKDKEKIDIEVEPNSLYIMSGDARYKWTHQMLSLKATRRISITYRMV